LSTFGFVTYTSLGPPKEQLFSWSCWIAAFVKSLLEFKGCDPRPIAAFRGGMLRHIPHGLCLWCQSALVQGFARYGDCFQYCSWPRRIRYRSRVCLASSCDQWDCSPTVPHVSRIGPAPSGPGPRLCAYCACGPTVPAVEQYSVPVCLLCQLLAVVFLVHADQSLPTGYRSCTCNRCALWPTVTAVPLGPVLFFVL
jgi:hypothetical protein